MTQHPTTEEVAGLLDNRLASVVGGNQIRLQREYGLESLLAIYIKAFPMIRNCHGRIEILFWIRRYARTEPDVVRLALKALKDPSRMVRYHACGTVAYACHREALPTLGHLLKHNNQKTREDAKAAIEAITEENHHLYVDRTRSGKHYWIVNPGDDPRSLEQDAVTARVVIAGESALTTTYQPLDGLGSGVVTVVQVTCHHDREWLGKIVSEFDSAPRDKPFYEPR